MFDPLKKAYSVLSQGAQKMRDEANSLNARERELVEERTSILARPLSKADYAALLRALIDRKADAQRARFARFFTDRARNGGVIAASVGFANDLRENGRRAEVMHTYGFLDARSDYPDAPIPTDAMFFLFREQIGKAVTEAVEAIEEWPWSDTVPLADSLHRFDEIDAELQSLAERRSAVNEQARELGIALNAPERAEP